jgi:hypothetical protein
MNEAEKSHSVRDALLICGAALPLPLLLSHLSSAAIESALGPYDLYSFTFWRGVPFHFVHPFEFGDEYRLFSAAYFSDVLFWVGVILGLRQLLRLLWLHIQLQRRNDNTRNA